VAASVSAPEGELRLIDRYRGAHELNEALQVHVEGDLTLARTPADPELGGNGTFQGDVRLDGSRLMLRDARGAGSTLSIRRTDTSAGEAHIDAQIGDAFSGKQCLRVGPDPGSGLEPVLSVCNEPLVTVHGPLNVEETLTTKALDVAESTSIGGDLRVEGGSELAGRVTVESRLEVSGAARFASTVDIAGELDVQSGIRGNLLNLDFGIYQALATGLPVTVGGSFQRIAASPAAQATLRRAQQAAYLEISLHGPAGRISPVSLSFRPTGRNGARRSLLFNGPIASHVWFLKPDRTDEPFEYDVHIAPSAGDMTLDVFLAGIL